MAKKHKTSVLDTTFREGWEKLSLEMKQNIIGHLLEHFQPPDSADRAFLYDRDTDVPAAREVELELAFVLGSVSSIIPLRDASFYPLAKLRALWSVARKTQIEVLQRMNAQKQGVAMQNLLCSHVRNCDRLISHGQWVIGDEAGRAYKEWDFTLAVANYTEQFLLKQKGGTADQRKGDIDQRKRAILTSEAKARAKPRWERERKNAKRHKTTQRATRAQIKSKLNGRALRSGKSVATQAADLNQFDDYDEDLDDFEVWWDWKMSEKL